MLDYEPPPSIQEEVMAFLLISPTPQQIIDFHAFDAAQEQLRALLEGNRQGTLNPAERAALGEASQMNHFMMLLKAKAYQAIQAI